MKKMTRYMAAVICLSLTLAMTSFASESGGDGYVDPYVPPEDVYEEHIDEEEFADRVSEREDDPLPEIVEPSVQDMAIMASKGSLDEAKAKQDNGIFAKANANADTLQPYTGRLDPATGLPMEKVPTLGEVEKAEVVAPDTVIPRNNGKLGYNVTQNMYITYVSKEAVLTSYPAGALTTDKISVSVPDTLKFSLYQGGNQVEKESGNFELSGAGTYMLKVWKDNETTATDLLFTIITPYTNKAVDYKMPTGFNVEELYFNDEWVTPEYANYVEFAEDGKYKLVYADVSIDKRYTLEFTRDTVAPVLNLPGVKDGVSSGPVTIETLEPNTSFTYTYKGETVDAKTLPIELKEAGDYHIVSRDVAGNTTTLDLHIQIYLNITAMFAIVLVGGLGGGLFAYSRWVRRTAKIG